jgi:alpha-galactosidase
MTKPLALRFVRRSAFFVIALNFATSAASAESALLSELDLSKVKVTDNIRPTVDKTIDGNPLKINGKTFERGICVNGYTVMYVELAGGTERFTAIAGIDDEAAQQQAGRGGQGRGRGQGGGRQGGRGRGRGQAPRTMSVRILADGNRSLFENHDIRPGTDGLAIDVDTRGVQLLAIVLDNGNQRYGQPPVTHVDLVDARFESTGVRPKVVAVSGEERIVLTPKAGPEPKINGPVLTGVSPGKPVLYKIPATGAKPITYSAAGLPDGLTLDPATGIISGMIKDRGTHPVTFRAKNATGETSREFKFVAEGTLALTPPLGWNSWNARGRSVTDELVRKTADAFVDKGLVDYGWQYICIDDGWERSANMDDLLYEGPTRDENGRFLTNKKFPDMKALGDYIHAKGLKYGIYSSPGPVTCQRLEASFGHEESDVAQFCEWGVDYLKYDWCSYRATEEGLAGAQAPYRLMRSILDKAPRDIVYSVCQYGRNSVWEWGNNPDIRGNLWRTTGDIRDTWWQTRQIGFNPRWTEIDIAQYGGPGHWNDVDMLVVGVVGWSYEPLHETKLSPSEQYTHISLWVLHAAPLILGCHLHEADDFTVNLLTNAEVLAVNQDPLGRGGKAVSTSDNGHLQVWSRPLADGSQAVGLFNLDEMPTKVTARWSDLGISGRQAIRDLWRQKELGEFSGEFSAAIARHDCLLLKITPVK